MNRSYAIRRTFSALVSELAQTMSSNEAKTGPSIVYISSQIGKFTHGVLFLGPAVKNKDNAYSDQVRSYK